MSNRLTDATDPASDYQQYTEDTAGRMTRQKDPRSPAGLVCGYNTDFTDDFAGRIDSVTRPNNSVTWLAFQRWGLVRVALSLGTSAHPTPALRLGSAAGFHT